MAYTANTRKAFLLLLLVVSLLSLLSIACDDTCISRNKDGVCIETAGNIIPENKKMLSEIVDFDLGTGNILTGGSGKATCQATGLNCD